jgi:hypothetical protein
MWPAIIDLILGILYAVLVAPLKALFELLTDR